MAFELGAIIARRFRLLRRLLVDACGAIYLALDGRSGAHVWLRVVAAEVLATVANGRRETLPLSDVTHLSAIGGPLPRLTACGPLSNGGMYVAESVVETDQVLVRHDRPSVGERIFLQLVDALGNFWRRGLAHGCLSEAHVATTPSGIALRFGVPWALTAPTVDGAALVRLADIYAPETPRLFAVRTLGSTLASGTPPAEALPEFYRSIRALAAATSDQPPPLGTRHRRNESAVGA